MFIYNLLVCAELYEDSSYNGWVEKVEVTSKGNLGHRNDMVSSIKVMSGCTLKAYRDLHLQGLMFTATNDMRSLGSNNDLMSSYSCSCSKGKLFVPIATKGFKMVVLSQVRWLKNYCYSLSLDRTWSRLDNVAIAEGRSVGGAGAGYSLEECKELCTTNPNCNSFAFSAGASGKGACWLKDKCIVDSEPTKNSAFKTYYKNCIGKFNRI